MKNKNGLKIWNSSFYRDEQGQDFVVNNCQPDQDGKIEVTEMSCRLSISGRTVRINPNRLVKEHDVND